MTEPPAASTRTALPPLEAAIESAFAFLARGPFEEGEIALTCRSRGGEAQDRSLFAAALALHALAGSPNPAADRFRRNATRLLAETREEGGVWRFWPPGHPRHDSIPPDLEDTACAASALRDAGIDPGVDVARLASQRNPDGRFRTWIVAPGSAFASSGHPFWRDTEARPDDVDAGANAQGVALLAASGEAALAREAAGWLLDMIRSGSEAESDKWYRSAWFVRYLVARAAAVAADLAPARGEIARAMGTDLDRVAASDSAPEIAVSLSTALGCGVPVPELAPLGARLLALQRVDGSFPRAPVWYGGPKRSVDWGSPELSTVLALEALESVLRFEGRASRASSR